MAPTCLTVIDPPKTSVQVEVVSRDEGLRRWRALEDRLQPESLASSSLWIEVWLNHFGDLIPHEFLVVRNEQETIGCGMLARSRFTREGPFWLATMHFGTAGEPDAESVFVEYNRPLVAPGHEDQFARAVLDHVDKGRWDRFQLDGMDSEIVGPFLKARDDWDVRTVPSWYFDLSAIRSEGKDVLSRLGASTRRTISRSIRDLEPTEFDWAETQSEADSIFQDLIRLHQERWTEAGEPGCFASRRFTGFHRELIARLLPERRAVLARLRQGSHALGCSLLYAEGKRLLFQQSGNEQRPKVSIGQLIDFRVLESAFERGFDEVDFLGGNSQHKRNLSTDARELTWAYRRRPTAKLRIAKALRTIRSWLRR